MAAPVLDQPGPATAEAGSLEIIELELALKHQDFIGLGFEGAVCRALASAGGALLFHMRMDGMAGCDWVAAVSIARGEERRYALVVQPADGGPLRVEDVDTSDIPLARITPAYAGLMEQLSRA
jgi:hypothetical protein